MRNSLRIPTTDPKRGYLAHKEAIDRAITKVLGEGQYILGKEVTAFEASFAAFVGARAAVGVGSGTDALVLAPEASPAVSSRALRFPPTFSGPVFIEARKP